MSNLVGVLVRLAGPEITLADLESFVDKCNDLGLDKDRLVALDRPTPTSTDYFLVASDAHRKVT